MPCLGQHRVQKGTRHFSLLLLLTTTPYYYSLLLLLTPTPYSYSYYDLLLLLTTTPVDSNPETASEVHNVVAPRFAPRLPAGVRKTSSLRERLEQIILGKQAPYANA